MDAVLAIRQTSALILVSALVWDTFREKEQFTSELASWTVAANFIYFQLPLKSRALAFFHPLAFVSSIVTPACYVFHCYLNPQYEKLRMDDWGVKWGVMLMRGLLFYALPLFFHAIDISAIRSKLIFAYQGKSRKLQIAWCILGFFCMDLAHQFMASSGGGEGLLTGGGDDFLLMINVKIIAVSLAFFVQYMLILRWAFPPQHAASIQQRRRATQ